LIKVHCGSFFGVVNNDLYSSKGPKIRAQQIHMLEMRVGVQRVHNLAVAIDLKGK
jgi:hypothetical protein